MKLISCRHIKKRRRQRPQMSAWPTPGRANEDCDTCGVVEDADHWLAAVACDEDEGEGESRLGDNHRLVLNSKRDGENLLVHLRPARGQRRQHNQTNSNSNNNNNNNSSIIQSSKRLLPLALMCLMIISERQFWRPTAGSCRNDKAAWPFQVSGVSATSDENRLYEDLMMTYNRIVRPVQNESDRVVVRLSLKLSQLMDVEWSDYKLKWDPTEYGGIQDINLPAEQIWLPDITLYNSAEGNFAVSIMTKAKVRFDGRVTWNPPAIFRSSCQIDITYYPFDSQNCHLKFGSWTFGTKIDLRHINDTDGTIEHGTDLSEYYQNVEWDIMQASARRNVITYICCPNDFYPDVTFNFTLRRKPLFYTVNLVLPCIGITFFSFLVFYLPSDSGEKVTLTISILVSLIFFLSVLIETIPSTSLAMPLLGKYLVFTMILITMSVCATVCVLNVHFRTPSTHSMPPWIKRWCIDILPKYLFMSVPQYQQSQQQGGGTSILPEQLIYLHNQAYATQAVRLSSVVPATATMRPSATMDQLATGASSTNGVNPNNSNMKRAPSRHQDLNELIDHHGNQMQQQKFQIFKANGDTEWLENQNNNINSNNINNKQIGSRPPLLGTHETSTLSKPLSLQQQQQQQQRTKPLKRNGSSLSQHQAAKTMVNSSNNNNYTEDEWQRKQAGQTEPLDVGNLLAAASSSNNLRDINPAVARQLKPSGQIGLFLPYLQSETARRLQLQRSRSSERDKTTTTNTTTTTTTASDNQQPTTNGATNDCDRRATRPEALGDQTNQQQQRRLGSRPKGATTLELHPVNTNSKQQQEQKKSKRPLFWRLFKSSKSQSPTNEQLEAGGQQWQQPLPPRKDTSSTNSTANTRPHRLLGSTSSSTSSGPLDQDDEYQHHRHFQARASLCSNNLWRIGPTRGCNLAAVAPNYPTYYRPSITMGTHRPGRGSSQLETINSISGCLDEARSHKHHRVADSTIPMNMPPQRGATVGQLISAATSTFPSSPFASLICGNDDGRNRTQSSGANGSSPHYPDKQLEEREMEPLTSGGFIRDDGAQVPQNVNAIPPTLSHRSCFSSISQDEDDDIDELPDNQFNQSATESNMSPMPPPPPPLPPHEFGGIQASNASNHQQSMLIWQQRAARGHAFVNHQQTQQHPMTSLNSSSGSGPMMFRRVQLAQQQQQQIFPSPQQQQQQFMAPSLHLGITSSSSHNNQLQRLSGQSRSSNIPSGCSTTNFSLTGSQSKQQPISMNSINPTSNLNNFYSSSSSMRLNQQSQKQFLAEPFKSTANMTYRQQQAQLDSYLNPSQLQQTIGVSGYHSLTRSRSTDHQLSAANDEFSTSENYNPMIKPNMIHQHSIIRHQQQQLPQVPPPLSSIDKLQLQTSGQQTIGRALGQVYMRQLHKQPTIYTLHSSIGISPIGNSGIGSQHDSINRGFSPINVQLRRHQQQYPSIDMMRRSKSQTSLNRRGQSNLPGRNMAQQSNNLKCNQCLPGSSFQNHQHQEAKCWPNIPSNVSCDCCTNRPLVTSNSLHLSLGDHSVRRDQEQCKCESRMTVTKQLIPSNSFNSCCSRRSQQQQVAPISTLNLLKLIGEVEKAIQNAMFIAQHIDNLDEFESVKENWKYIAMVIDRIFLIIFLFACFFGTVAIFSLVPWYSYLTETPIDSQWSRLMSLNLTTAYGNGGGGAPYSRACQDL